LTHPAGSGKQRSASVPCRLTGAEIFVCQSGEPRKGGGAERLITAVEQSPEAGA